MTVLGHPLKQCRRGMVGLHRQLAVSFLKVGGGRELRSTCVVVMLTVSLVANHVWSPYIRTEVVRAAGGEILGGGEGGRGGELKPICVEQAVVLFTESPAPSCFDWTPEGCLILEKTEKTALATYKTAWPSSTF